MLCTDPSATRVVIVLPFFMQRDMVALITTVFIFAIGGVRGFAFTLGLTTIIDLIIIFLFTKPLVTFLSRLPFFANGHPLSGLDTSKVVRGTAGGRQS